MNLPFRTQFLDDEWKEALKINPIIVLMAGDAEEFGPNGHWIVLIESNKDFLHILTLGIKK